MNTRIARDLIVTGGIFFLSVTPAARAERSHDCTHESLHGSYGYVLSGPLIGVGPVAAVGLTAFDGEGNLTAQDTVSTKGVLSRRTGTGSYTVNPNCTGSASLAGDFAGFAFNFMIVPGMGGSELSFIVATPGTVQTGVASKTGGDDDGCTVARLE